MPSWPTGIPKTLNAAQRSERARNAALTRVSPDHYIRKLAQATLTDEQRQRLAAVLMRDLDTDDGQGAAR